MDGRVICYTRYEAVGVIQHAKSILDGVSWGLKDCIAHKRIRKVLNAVTKSVTEVGMEQPEE